MSGNSKDRIELLKADKECKSLTDEELVRLATIKTQPKALVDLAAKEVARLLAEKHKIDEALDAITKWLNGYDLEYRAEADLSDFDLGALALYEHGEIE